MASHNEPKDYLRLSSKGLTKEQIEHAYEKYGGEIRTQRDNFLGYQANEKLNYEQLSGYLQMHLNNVGDPFEPGNFTVNTKDMEIAVLDYYAKLWHLKTPHNPNDLESYWGYVLSMGSTEGNMYGLWQGRDYLQGKTLYHEEQSTFDSAAKNTSVNGPTAIPFLYKSVRGRFTVQAGSESHAKKPIVFFSEDTHYSIVKICRVLDLPTFYEVGTDKYPNDNPLSATGQHEPWSQTVPSDDKGNGTIDIEKLLTLVEFFASKGYPPLIVLNYGTTFKGAYDNVEEIGRRLIPILHKYGLDEREVTYAPGKTDKRNGYWIHVDAALGGTYGPFLRMAAEQGKWVHEKEEVPPQFDFSLPFVHSINSSGHKWPGAPWPCGVFLTKVKYQINPPSDPAYIGSPDTTFAGSRNGFSAMIFWHFLAHRSYDDQIEEIVKNENMAKYARDQLQKLSVELGKKYGKTPDEKKDFLWVARSPASLTVRFRRPNADIVHEFSLSGEAMYVDAPSNKTNGDADHDEEKSEKSKKSKKNPERPDTKILREYSHIYMMHHTTQQRIDKLIEALKQPGAFVLSQEEASSTPAEETTSTSDTHPRVLAKLQARSPSERKISFSWEAPSPKLGAPRFHASLEDFRFPDLKAHAFFTRSNSNSRGF